MEEIDKNKNGNKLSKQVQIFINYGVFGGVFIPFLIPVVTFFKDKANLNMDLDYPIVKGREFHVIGTMILYIVIVVIVAYFFMVVLSGDGSKDITESKRKTIRNILYILGFISLFTLFLIIIWTGGAMISPLSGYFIYVPAVLYITFHDISKAFWAAITAILLAICSTPAIIPSLFSSYNSVNSSSYLYQYYYLIVLCWQIIASILVAAAFNFNIMDAVKSSIKKLFIRNNLEQK